MIRERMVISMQKRPKLPRRKAKGMPGKQTDGSAPIEERAIRELRCIIDPHTNISVYDMGLIEKLRTSRGTVSLVFRPTSPFCPLATQLVLNIQRGMRKLDGVKDVSVTIVGHYQEDNINNLLRGTAAPDPPKKKPKMKR